MIRAAIKHRQIVFYFVFIMVFGGIYGYTVLPKQEAPDINPPVTRITAVYPGASQKDMEEFVTKEIEETLMNMEAYDYAFSYTYNSIAIVICFMEYGYESDVLWTEVRREMDDLQADLPEGVEPLEVNTNLSDTAGMIISLTGEGYDYDTLGFYGERIIDDLKRTEGVTKFEMIGEVGKEVLITLDSRYMNQLDISYGEVSQLLQGQNLEIPSGGIDVKGEEVPIRIKGSFSSLEDIENIVVGVSEDNYSVLKLRDIATVEMAEEEASTVFLRNGSKAVMLVGYFENNKNVLAIGDDVRKKIEGIRADLPPDLQFEEVVFQPTEVERAINGFLVNLLIGIGLVIVVVFIGMGFRNAIIVSMAIPTSIMTTFLMMPVFGIKVHVISITAFIVALGMLVDNAIVVSDAIQNKLDKGVDRLEACVEGAGEVILSILTSTLTTVAAFSPLLLLNSVAGDYVKALPQVVIISLAASFFFAFLVTPSLAYIFFESKPHRTVGNKKTFMQVILDTALERKFAAFLSGIVIIALLGSTIILLNVIFFPKADKDVIYIDVEAERNIDTDFTKTVTDQVEAVLAEEAGITAYTTAIGGALPKFYTTMGIYSDIPETAQILVDVDLSQTDFSKNTDFARYLQERVDRVLVGGEATFKELEYAEPISAPVYIRLLGSDMDRIWEVGSRLEAVLSEVPGAVNVRTDYEPYRYEYEVALMEDALSYYGLMKYDVLNEVSIALRGRDSGVFKKDGKEYAIKLTGDLETVDDVENLMIKSGASSSKHLLKDFGGIDLSNARASVQKYDGDMAIGLMCDLAPGYDSGTVEKAFKEKADQMDLGNVSLAYDGESSKINVYFGNLGITAIFAVVMIFTILLFQFRNYRNALIILLSLPLSAAGAVFGLFMMDQPISFTAMLGIISLIGIVVNNAIVLMEYINMERAEGMEVDEAVVRASVVRFRPIILSTITTVTGLLPLMFSNSELFKPMATALVFGLLISTFLTLVFIPLTYSVVYHKP